MRFTRMMIVISKIMMICHINSNDDSSDNEIRNNSESNKNMIMIMIISIISNIARNTIIKI